MLQSLFNTHVNRLTPNRFPPIMVSWFIKGSNSLYLPFFCLCNVHMNVKLMNLEYLLVPKIISIQKTG